MTFSLINERVEQTTTTYHTRSPVLSFVSEASGRQYIEVKLTEEKSVNGVVIEEVPIDTVTVYPDELVGVEMVHPLTGQAVIVNGETLKINPDYVYMILYTIFKKAVTKMEQR